PPALALSPDGSYLAYVARSAGVRTLCVHNMPRATTSCIPGTNDAAAPFFSPDSRWIGFLASNLVKKAAIGGGSVQAISEAKSAWIGKWEADDTIILATPEGIMTVPASGGNIV